MDMLLVQTAVVESPAWVGPTIAIAVSIIAVGFFAIAFGAVLAFRKIGEAAQTLQHLRDDLGPAMKSLHGLTEKGNEITNTVRTEVLAVVDTSRQLRGQVESGVARVRDRLGDLEALYDVVEEELEDTALSVASALRRVPGGGRGGDPAQADRQQTPAAMKARRIAVTALLAGALLALFPSHLFAWTPGTHIYLGESVLANLGVLPGRRHRPDSRLSLRLSLRQHRGRFLDREEVRPGGPALSRLARRSGDLRQGPERCAPGLRPGLSVSSRGRHHCAQLLRAAAAGPHQQHHRLRALLLGKPDGDPLGRPVRDARPRKSSCSTIARRTPISIRSWRPPSSA